MDRSKFYIYRRNGSPVIHMAGGPFIPVTHIDCRVPTWSLDTTKEETGADFVMCGEGIVDIDGSTRRCVITDGR